MKFGKVGQVGLVSGIALVVATLFTACGTLNVGFLYVATNRQTPGQIEVYEVDSESGGLRTIPTSPFPSGGRDPISEAASPNFQNLYVANQDDNNIVQFGIGSDGKLYPQSTINTPGTYPLAVAINAAGTFAYVVDILGPNAGCSLANPCPGVIAGYSVTPMTSTVNPGSLGLAPASCATVPAPSPLPSCSLGNPVINSNSATYVPLQLTPSNSTTILTPTALNILANGNFLYVSAYNAASKTGYLFGYSVGSTGGLTPLNGGIPVVVGSQPVALISDSGSQTLYIVDEAKNQISSFAVQSSGALSLIGTTATGDQPTSVALFKDTFLYVTNSLDSTVTAYSASAGNLTQLGNYASGIDPIAVTVDPRNIGFLYTVNFLGNSISGYQINASTGALINAQRSPFLSSVQPTAISGIPHGGNSTSTSSSGSGN